MPFISPEIRASLVAWRRSVLGRRLVGLASVVLLATLPATTPAQDSARNNVWPDNPLARAEILALLQGFNADLLSHDSATLTLERWCAAHAMATPAKVIAQRVTGAEKPIPADLRAQLAIGPDEPLRYRRVQLSCGGHVLSEADNWYVPGHLTAAMNQQLDTTDTPFGRVVQPLHFRRQTLDATLLWSPLPVGWEMQAPAAAHDREALRIPHQLLQHRAVLYAADGKPFSALIETYTEQVLAFPHDLGVVKP